MHRMLTIWLCLCAPLGLYAQYNFGAGNSNYSGIQGSLINPGITAGSPIKWEINGLSGDLLYDNNFVFIPKGSVPVFGFGSVIHGIINNNKFATTYDPADPGRSYQFTMSTEVVGPSFRMDIGANQSVGFTLAARAYADVRHLPGYTAQNAFAYLLEDDLWNKPLSDHSSRLNAMGWLEYRADYSAILFDDGQNRWKAGIGLSYLQGVVAAYVKNTNLNYTIGDTAQLSFAPSSVDYGRTDYDSYRKIGSYGDLNHGFGFGVNAGVVFVHAEDTRRPEDYIYRLGFSVMDIGSIKYDRNAAAFHLQTEGGVFSDWRQTRLTSNLAVDRTLSAVFYQGDSGRSVTGNSFRMALPTALSLQADYHLMDHYYLNATLVKGLGHGDRQGAIEPDLYSVTPRYESKWWDLSVPLSLLYYGQWRARVGLAVRAGYFFFGGDAPAALLGLNNWQGTDFYAGIRFFVLK